MTCLGAESRYCCILGEGGRVVGLYLAWPAFERAGCLDRTEPGCPFAERSSMMRITYGESLHSLSSKQARPNSPRQKLLENITKATSRHEDGHGQQRMSPGRSGSIVVAPMDCAVFYRNRLFIMH